MNKDPAELRLWAHQLDAVRTCERYFASDSSHGCLVHMPTGTGKTGVMAVLAVRRATMGPVLVVCPSAALVDQLTHEFASKFWTKIGASSEWRPDHVRQALPGSLSALASELETWQGSRTIVVATIQAMQQIYAAGNIADLQKYVRTIIFDEGHREPAPLWAKVIRSFSVPTVLFSATPFRGDLKVFDVDDDHIHFLSFQDSVDRALIRGVSIVQSELSENPAEFAKQIIAERNRLISDGVFGPHNKVVVRAASEDAVSELFVAFSAELSMDTDGVLAIHNNFSLHGDIGSQRRPDVPTDLVHRPEKYLIHQFMLVEGIDDPNCTMLAMYDPFTSTRMLVQQVGRLTRQPSGQVGIRAADARVFARPSDGVGEQWNSFLEFDSACVANGGKPPLRKGEEVLRQLVTALPNIDYVQGVFRHRIDLEDADLSSDLLFPKAAFVFEIQPGFDLDNFQSDLSALLDAEDRFEHQIGNTVDGSCRYHVSLALTQSPFLANYLFQAPSLEVTIYAKVGHRLFFYDSAGLWIDELEGIGARLSPKVLQSLLPSGADNAISFLAVKNTDLGPLAVRSRTLSARSLERSGVFMGEHMNVVTRATGWVDKVRRSIGFSRARVREGDGFGATAEEYVAWCGGIESEIKKRQQANPLLARFAVPAATPRDTAPVNILVDMRELADQFGSSDGSVSFDVDGLCVDIEQAGVNPKPPAPFHFSISVEGKPHSVWIKWDAKKKKYWLFSGSLSQIKSKLNPKVSLVRRLNQLQAFRIITADHRHVYVDGAFYVLDLNLADPNGAGRMILDLITPLAGLQAITSEKGVPKGETLTTWRAGSLFRFIDDALVKGRGKQVFGQAFPAFVCDDFGTEAGDFIGADDDIGSPRVVFVVAKHKQGDPGVSASAFYDVTSQGLKNLAFLKSDGVDLPGSAQKFDRYWTLSKDGKTDRVPRRRAGPGSVGFRTLFNRVKRAPAAERALWMVCAGGMISKSVLEREFRADRVNAHVLQFYHLVVSAYSACQSVGVGLKIFSAD
ncbi:MAG: DEAD/DEAH box helicase family protein [Alphaproteobacteria bacterium]|nr:DEAD/DEAH box helicase family protein [Alphaproteobacteria bacterium]